MNKKPPGRQSSKTQLTLKKAFAQLLGETNYDKISIGDIADHANVGRSTFYHHYQSKADLLLDWHGDIFRSLNIGHYTSAEWTNNAPPSQLVAFFERMKNSRMPLHDFGQDFMFVLRSMGDILTKQIEENLKTSFIGANFPLEITARAIAGIYMGIFQWWIFDHPPYSPHEMANYTHQMIAATVRASIN